MIEVAAPEWHELVHSGAAVLLVVLGSALLFLASRAWTREREAARPSWIADRRGSIHAAIAVSALGAAVVLLMLAARAVTLQDAVATSTLTALLGALTLHSVRRASFNEIATIPLVGLVGIATLLAVAGPQPALSHAHVDPAVQEIHHTH